MHRELVIAWYREDLKWVRSVRHMFDTVTIYDKNHDAAASEKVRRELNATIIWLPNVGREGHTYAWHIVENYGCLADLTVFCQGGLEDHTDPVSKFDELQDLEAYQPLSDLFIPVGHPDVEKAKRQFLPLQLIANALLGPQAPRMPVSFWANGCFAAGAKCIRARQVQVYGTIVKLLKHSSDPLEGHCIERLWGEILNYTPPPKFTEQAQSPVLLL